MQHTWRWFGSEDPVSLGDIRQTGANGVVTALHHIKPGMVWDRRQIRNTKPGYPAIGRLKGLAEIRGIETAFNYFQNGGHHA